MVFWTRLLSIRHFGVRIATEQRAQIVGQHRGVYVYQQRMLSQAGFVALAIKRQA